MKQILATVALMIALTGLAERTAAQQQEYWILLESHSSLESALERARQLSQGLPGLQGIQTRDGRFMLVLGKFDFQEGRNIRIELSNSHAIPQSSRLDRDIAVASYFWPVGGASRGNIQSTGSGEFEHDEKIAIQLALQWFGYYMAEIDGLFGSGTRQAISDFQQENELEPTGILTRAQASILLDQYNSETARVQMHPTEDEATGISIDIPQALVRFASIDAPFVTYESISDEGMTLYLVSMEGGRQTLASLRDIFRESGFLPAPFDSDSSGTRFVIRGQDDQASSFAFARLFGDRLKGFALSWSRQHDPLGTRVAAGIMSSFGESHDGTLDPALAITRHTALGELGSVLPRWEVSGSSSGLFINETGLVATTASVVADCTEIRVESAGRMTIRSIEPALDLAILEPTGQLSPISRAMPGSGNVPVGGRILVSGFSYGGRLGSPTLTRGAWLGSDPVTGDDRLAVINADLLPGDPGGPVLDQSGKFVGMLRPRVSAGNGRTLPEDVHHVITSGTIARQVGLVPDLEESQERTAVLPDAEINRRARAMTVLVQCYSRK